MQTTTADIIYQAALLLAWFWFLSSLHDDIDSNPDCDHS